MKAVYVFRHSIVPRTCASPRSTGSTFACRPRQSKLQLHRHHSGSPSEIACNKEDIFRHAPTAGACKVRIGFQTAAYAPLVGHFASPSHATTHPGTFSVPISPSHTSHSPLRPLQQPPGFSLLSHQSALSTCYLENSLKVSGK